MTYYSIILFALVSPIIQNIFTYYSNNFTNYSSYLHLILTFNSIIVYVLSIRKGIRKISESHMIIIIIKITFNFNSLHVEDKESSVLRGKQFHYLSF